MYRLGLPFTDAVLLLSSRWREMSPGAIMALALFCILVPTAVVLLYRYEMRLVKPGTAAGLLALRLLTALFVLFVLVFQPVFERSTSEEVSARVMVAVDRSNSMKVGDPQLTPVEKLRLARALKMSGDASEAQVDDWIRQYDEKKSVEFVGRDEFGGDPTRRSAAAGERQRTHDQICQLIDRLTRAGVAQRLLSGDGPDLLGSLARKHKVEIVGFSREVWDVPPEQLDELLERYAHVRQTSSDKKGEEPQSNDKDFQRDDATDISLPLSRALERSGVAERQILGVVLLSDGRHTAYGSKSPAEIAERMRPEIGTDKKSAADKDGDRKKHIPIFPIALGARRPPPDVALASVETNPKTVFKNMDVAVDARVKISGMPAQEIVVELQRTGKPPLRERIRHDGKDRYYPVRFSLKMEEVGEHLLRVAIDPVAGEVRRDNNSQPVYVNVADDKAKVLVVDGEARWEFHYLWSALLRDPQMKPESILFTQPRLGRIPEEDLEKMNNPKLQWPTDPDALAGYDCIVLGDVTPAQLPLAERARLEKYVSDRGGTLIILAGKRSMPMAFRDLAPVTLKPGDKEQSDPLAKLLPIEDPRTVKPVEGFPLTFTHQGRLTKFLEMDPAPDLNSRIWAQLPRHYWGAIGKAKPGAQVLAYVAGGEANQPRGADADASETEPGRNQALIVRQNYGFGRVLYIGVDSTWRWRYRTGDTYHHRFWSQVVHWAAADKPLVAGNDHIRFGTRDPVYRQGSEIDLVARMADSEKPLPPDAIAGARILKLPDDPKGSEEAAALVPLKKKDAQPRILDGKVPPYLAPGKYAIELAIPELAGKLEGPPAADGKPGKLRASFAVLPGTSEESLELGTNFPLLEEIATKTGGKVLTPENAGEVVDLLAKRTATIDRHDQQKVWEWGWTLAVFLLLVTVEWVSRKLAGLP
jgi:hypothetical protein